MTEQLKQLAERIDMMLYAEESYITQGIRDGLLRDFAELIAERDEYAAAADAMAASHKVERDGLRAALQKIAAAKGNGDYDGSIAREALKGWVEP
jgi:cytochrome c556